MESKINKPRLVFFQWKHDRLPKFLQLHMQLHVKCLSEFFDVILINNDCDYQQVCDKYEPDLALFESGWKSILSKRINIKNTFAYPEIPKVGLHNGDAWCTHRAGFISDMEHWGIETFFSICTTTGEHTPEIAEILYVWPNFIDTDIYHDYRISKTVQVLFSGSTIPLYPWRQKIFKIIADNYSPRFLPHLGYENTSSTMIYGEQYARAINASWFVPTCGSIAKEVVRKHFEIPGCNSCLITEKSASLEAAGFVDMKNCVFADEKDVIDKLNYLFKNTNELKKIIDNGYQLVQNNHTLKQRDQIFQWFNLCKSLKPNQKIIQKNPFNALSIVEKSSGIKSTPIICGGLHLELLRQGDNELWAGNYIQAEVFYLKCLNYEQGFTEPKLRLTLCSLYKGNASVALKWIIEPIKKNIGVYEALDPDPVDWAYYIISLLCHGNLNKAIIRVNQFPSLSHPELDRTRWIIACLQNKKNSAPIADKPVTKSRYSIYCLPQMNFLEWIGSICKMLKACRQYKYAEIITSIISQNEELLGGFTKNPEGGLKKNIAGTAFGHLKNYLFVIRIKWLRKLNIIYKSLNFPSTGPELPPIYEIDYIVKVLKWAKINCGKKIKPYLRKLSLSN